MGLVRKLVTRFTSQGKSCPTVWTGHGDFSKLPASENNDSTRKKGSVTTRTWQQGLGELSPTLKGLRFLPSCKTSKLACFTASGGRHETPGQGQRA